MIPIEGGDQNLVFPSLLLIYSSVASLDHITLFKSIAMFCGIDSMFGFVTLFYLHMLLVLK